MEDKEMERLIIKYLSFIKKICYKFTKDYDKAELLKSEVLEKIWRYREKFTGKDEEFNFWSYRIIYNSFINNYRKKRIIPFTELDTAFDNMITSDHYNYTNIDYVNNIYSLLDHKYLNSEFVNTFKVVVESGLNSDELSKILKTPRGTIRRRVFEIRKFIKQNLHRL